jgi:hypothetical protein
MKAGVRKEVVQLLETLQPKSSSSRHTLERLQEAFKLKGTLSKRELRELMSLQPNLSQAA